MNINEMSDKAYELYQSGNGLRVGQCFMNLLYEENIKLYRIITGSHLDPFYSESRFLSSVLMNFLSDWEKEKILCSAIWYDIDSDRYEMTLPENKDRGLMITGLRHHNCIAISHSMLPNINKNYDSIQGFLTSHNRFVDREEGYNIAVEADQTIQKNNMGKDTLYSEDLW